MQIDLITRDEKIVIPQQLQRRVVEWYHTFLCHPGGTKTKQTIRQYFIFKDLRPMIYGICNKCSVCQKSKKHTKNNGLLPEKEDEINPWEVLCVDCIGL